MVVITFNSSDVKGQIGITTHYKPLTIRCRYGSSDFRRVRKIAKSDS